MANKGLRTPKMWGGAVCSMLVRNLKERSCFYPLEKPYMESLHCLLILDRLLRSHRHPVPPGLFLAKMECSLSTLKRLIKVLREQYNYPIRYSREHKGYHYDRTQALPVSGLWFTADELQALLMIRQLLQRLEPVFVKKVVASPF